MAMAMAMTVWRRYSSNRYSSGNTRGSEAIELYNAKYQVQAQTQGSGALPVPRGALKLEAV
jgi:hypothetical protein